MPSMTTTGPPSEHQQWKEGDHVIRIHVYLLAARGSLVSFQSRLKGIKDRLRAESQPQQAQDHDGHNEAFARGEIGQPPRIRIRAEEGALHHPQSVKSGCENPESREHCQSDADFIRSE